MMKYIYACMLACLADSCSHAQGIPEPGLVFYGAISDSNNALSTSGTLIFGLRPSDGTADLVFTNELANINGQFSYLAQIPAESPLPGLPATDGVLKILAVPLTYTFTTATRNGKPLFFKDRALQSFVFSGNDRGRLVQIDFTSSPELDSNHNGINDEWEKQFFGRLLNAGEESSDPDGDGFSNLREYLAGTNPKDPNSTFRVWAEGIPGGGTKIIWTSVAGRSYVVLRSDTLSVKAADYTPIKTGIPSAGEKTTFTDPAIPTKGTFFYLLQTQP